METTYNKQLFYGGLAESQLPGKLHMEVWIFDISLHPHACILTSGRDQWAEISTQKRGEGKNHRDTTGLY